MPQCCALNCKNRGVHMFPKDSKRRIQWEKALLIKNFKASGSARLCAQHFKDDDYFGQSIYTTYEPLRRFLKKTAVPSVFCFTQNKPETPVAVERQHRHEKKNQQTLLIESVPDQKLHCTPGKPSTSKDVLTDLDVVVKEEKVCELMEIEVPALTTYSLSKSTLFDHKHVHGSINRVSGHLKTDSAICPAVTKANPILYHHPSSPPSWALRMLAKHIDLTLDEVSVNMINSEHKTPRFLEINPMGTIPCLQDGAFNISESHTINMYLLKKYRPQFMDELYPEDLQTRALIDQAMHFDTGVAFIRLKNIALPTFLYGQESISPELEAQVYDVYSIMERYLSKHVYAAADSLTLADFSLGCTFTALNEFIPVASDTYPKTHAWLAKLQATELFQEVALPGSKALGTAVRYYWQKNTAEHAQSAEAIAYVKG